MHASELGLDLSFPAICCQGAVVYGPNHEIVSTSPLEPQTVIDVIDGIVQKVRLCHRPALTF